MWVCAEGLVRAFVKNSGTCMSMWDWHAHVCRGVGMCMYRGVDTGMCEEWLAHVCINSGWHVRVCVEWLACACVQKGWHAHV